MMFIFSLPFDITCVVYNETIIICSKPSFISVDEDVSYLNDINKIDAMFYTVLLAAICIVLCALHCIIKYNRFARVIRLIPGMKEYFLFGNSLSLLFLSPVQAFKLPRQWALEFNGIYRFYAFFVGAINIYNPEDVEIILSGMKHHKKSLTYKFLRPWLSDGLLVSDGSKWQHRRKTLTGAFHFNILRKYFPILVEKTNQKLLKVLEKHEGKIIDVVPVLSEYTLDTICETAMGTRSIKETSSAGRKYKEAVYSIGKLVADRFFKLYLYQDNIYNITKNGKNLLKHISVIHKFTQNVINTRRIQRKEYNSDSHDDEDAADYVYKKGKRAAFLDLLLAAESDGLIDSAGIQEEVDTFMFEGYDTTASGLTFCLLALAENPTIQDKIVQELDEIFKGSDQSATVDDLASMNYLERCIKESLRLYPPVPFIGRTTSETVVLSNYTVPEGTMCHIHIFDLHRQESLYKDPLKFDPDRFLPQNSIGRHNYAYIPFSAGPRNCIGQKFAMMEMKLVVSTILRNFKIVPITTSSEVEFVVDLMLRCSHPILIKFIKR